VAKVLIIDDDPTTRNVLKRMLEDGGQHVALTASDGAQGLVAAAEGSPDVILLDIMMPGMNGLQVLQKLGEGQETKFIPVIMLTGVVDPEVKGEALRGLANRYLLKPVPRETLLTAIEKTLNP